MAGLTSGDRSPNGAIEGQRHSSAPTSRSLAGDQTHADHEQTLADRDQTLADADQTGLTATRPLPTAIRPRLTAIRPPATATSLTAATAKSMT